MANDPKTQPVLPAITGNPRADALWRYAAGTLGGAIVGVAVGWSRAHGWWVPSDDMTAIITQSVVGLILAGVATLLGYKATNKSELAVINNTVRAALTGEVPAAIAAKATEGQRADIEAAPGASISPVPPAPPVPPAV